MLPLADIKHAKWHPRREALRPCNDDSATGQTASAYNHVGNEYSRYADGDATDQPSGPPNRFAHADSIVWEAVCDSFDELRKAGVSSVRVLDAGCGPGIWTKRIAEYAHRAGLAVAVVGIDISKSQLEIARKKAAVFRSHCPNGDKSSLEFLEHDLAQPLPWTDGHFHVVLCNYTVLNHLAERTLPSAVAELCRVASGRVIATVRALGSPPSACIIGMEQVREYRHDPSAGELALVLKDGSEHRLPFNIFSAKALEAFFSPHAEIVDLRAMDLFVSRFAPDLNWTASLIDVLPERPAVVQKLKEMEDSLCRLPGWVDHGTHVLIVVQPRIAADRSQAEPPTVLAEAPVVTSFADFLAKRPR